MNLKNFSIIALIFIVPLIAYAIMSHNNSCCAKKVTQTNKPQIIKFTSAMCLDCKKLSEVMKDVYPKYSNKIMLVEIQVQNSDDYTKKQIEKYNVTLVPTLIILNSKGKKLNKFEGFVEKQKLEKLMKDLVNE